MWWSISRYQVYWFVSRWRFPSSICSFFSRRSLQWIECSRLQISLLSRSTIETSIDSRFHSMWKSSGCTGSSLYGGCCWRSLCQCWITGLLLCDACSTYQSNVTRRLSLSSNEIWSDRSFHQAKRRRRRHAKLKEPILMSCRFLFYVTSIRFFTF